MNNTQDIKRIKELIETLNNYRNAYYNENKMVVSDEQYDSLFDELMGLEAKTGILLANSPTQSVGYRVQSKLKKVTHNHPMLSLGKSTDWNDIIKWADGEDCVCSLKLDGCFTANTKILMADGTSKSIIDVKEGEYVLSFDENTKELSSQKVLNNFHNGEKPKELWTRLFYYTNDKKSYKNQIECTKNHKIFTPNGFVEAKFLKEGDFIYKTGHKISKRQEEIILGMLLGDGWLVNRSEMAQTNILEIHTSKTINNNYGELINLLEKAFASFSPKKHYRTSGYSKTPNNMIDINFHSIIVPDYIANIQNRLRVGLTFTEEICNNLTPLSLAILYLDDGSKAPSQNDGYLTPNVKERCNLHLNRHPLKNVKILSDYLNSIGIGNSYHLEKAVKDTSLGDGYVITINVEGTPVFWDLIAPYIPQKFRPIKLGLDKRWQEAEEIIWWEDNSFIGLVKVPIYRKEETSNCFYGKKCKRAYDLEIENNHTYFANGVAVHNCTVSIEYNSGGFLERAETRGNGEVGEDITENIKCVSNVPLKIDTHGKELIVDGEMIVKLDTFKKLNVNGEFSHPRNYAAGSIRQLDTNITKQRELSFIAWKYVEGYNKTDNFDDNLFALHQLGFEVVPFTILSKKDWEVEYLEKIEAQMRQDVEDYFLPIDGLVVTINDIQEGEKRGSTAHHPLHSMAKKRVMDGEETVLRAIKWAVGKSGVVSPVAEFDEVDLDGALTTKATLHNLSYIWALGIDVGSPIAVIRANEVIPRVNKNLGEIKYYEDYPRVCPSCGQTLTMEKSVTEYREGKGNQITGKDVGPIILKCENPNCPAKNLAKFTQFVSKAGMNIDGLSTAKIEALVDAGYVHCFTDFYHLDKYEIEICEMEGFGKKSYDKLISAIYKSSICKLENYLVALSIPGIGKSAAKTIHKHFNGEFSSFLDAFRDGFDFSQLKDFGTKTNDNLYNWYYNQYNRGIEDCLSSELTFVVDDNPAEKNKNVKGNESGEETVANATTNTEFFEGKTFVFTGALSKPRSFYEDIVEANGGKCSGSVSKKTNWLVTDDPNSGSSKAKKAKELGIPVLSEKEFLEKGGIND